jgi:hypothetical protein
LNRIEYNNTINDLLGTDIKLLDRLPQVGSAFGFDTVDVGLDVAGPTLERYIQAADVALAHGPRPSTIKNRFEINEKTKEKWSDGKRADRALFNHEDDHDSQPASLTSDDARVGCPAFG